MDTHTKAVSEIAGHVKHFYALQKPFRIYHGSTTSTRQSQLRRDEMIDTTLLNRVLYIDAEKQLAVVEPNVAMDQLVAVTTRHGLIPPVVMEFPGITVGGGFAGTAGESSSFKHGLFEHTIQSIEVVLANGDVVRASPHRPCRPLSWHSFVLWNPWRCHVARIRTHPFQTICSIEVRPCRQH